MAIMIHSRSSAPSSVRSSTKRAYWLHSRRAGWREEHAVQEEKQVCDARIRLRPSSSGCGGEHQEDSL